MIHAAGIRSPRPRFGGTVVLVAETESIVNPRRKMAGSHRQIKRRVPTAIVICTTVLAMIAMAIVFHSQLSRVPWYWQLGLALLAIAIIRGIVAAASKSREKLEIAYPEALFKAGRFCEALRHADEVIAKNPGNAEAYYLKGQCHDRLGQTALADAAWEKALELNPQHAGAAHDLACDCLDRKDYLRAAEYFAQARESGALTMEAATFEQNVQALKEVLTAKGLEAERGADCVAALEYADAIVRLVPDFAIGHAWRAKQRVNVGQYKEAIEDARECLRLDPKYTKANLVIQEAEERLNRAVAQKQLAAQGGSRPSSHIVARPSQQAPDEPTRLKPPHGDPTLTKPETQVARSGASGSQGTLWQVGQRVFDRQAIEIRRIVSTGGMGTVYYAWNHESDEPLAMKTVRLDVPGTAVSESRLREEAERWLRLGKHPRIVTLYGVEKVDYRYLVLLMEYIAGEPDVGPTLADHLRAKQRLEATAAARIGLGICEAMEFAHAQQRMVHRDLKPANVFLTSAGQVKVGDFGLAGPEGSPMGDFAGTPEYAAPEQWKQAATLKPTMDVYALGVILYEMLCGHRPIVLSEQDAHASPEVKLALFGKLHAQQTPAPLLSVCPGIPDALVLLIEQCLAKAPSKRPGDWHKLRSSLARFAGDTSQPVPTEPHVAPGDIGGDAYGRGVTADAMGKNEEALAHYQQAVRNEPYHSQRSEAWANMAKVLGQMGRHEESVKAARRALEIDPGDLPAMHCLGAALSSMNLHAQAVEAFDRLLAKAPDRADAHAAKGMCLLEMCNVDAAVASYGRAKDLDPNLHHVWRGLGMCARATGDLETSLAMFDRAISLYDAFADAHEDRAMALVSLGRNEEALEAFREAVRHEPENRIFIFNLGSALANLGRFAEAVSPLERAVELDPRDGQAHLWLARVCGELGRYQQAIRWGLRADELGEPEGRQVAELAQRMLQRPDRRQAAPGSSPTPIPRNLPVLPPRGVSSGTPLAPGRNDPCPCGSGKKYKACCGSPSAKSPHAQEAKPPAQVVGQTQIDGKEPGGRRICSCGADNPPANTFCVACGKRLPEITPTTCPQCRKPVPADVRFCIHCGKNIGSG